MAKANNYTAPKIPIQVQTFFWENELLESYAFENLRLGAGLTDYDFDPKN